MLARLRKLFLRYTNNTPAKKRQRILALDIIRGLFIIIVAVDHFAWTPSFFIQFATEKSWFFASAAEGFFVISGMLVGYIYGPKLLSALKPTVKRLWKRAALLYGLSVLFTLIFTAWLYFLPDGYPRLHSATQDFGTLIFNTLTLQYSYGWTDFLNRYAIFMFAAPAVLWLIAKGKWYIAWGASFLLWLGVQFYPAMSQFTAWQILFVSGIVLGYYLPNIELAFAELPKKRRTLLAKCIVGGAALSYIGAVLWLYAIQFAHQISPPNLLWIFHDLNTSYKFLLGYLDRDTLGIARLLIGTLWFAGLFVFIRRYEAQIDKASRGLITLLGKNSLFIYSLHAFIIFFIDALILPPSNPNLILNTILGLLFVGSLIFFTALKERYSRYTKAKQL